MQTLTLAVQNAVPPRDIGVATSTATFSRQMGGTIGTAVFLSILFSTVGDKIATAFRAAVTTPAFLAAVADPAVRANPVNQVVLGALGGGTGSAGSFDVNNSQFINHIDPRLARPFMVGFSDSMDLVFMVGAGVVAVAFVLLFFLKEQPLSNQSGMQARQADADARQADADARQADAQAAAEIRDADAAAPVQRTERVTTGEEVLAAD
jgi:hypothetical protein